MHTKTCPRCGQQLFDDMPICYECLYEFAVQDEIVPLCAYEEGEGSYQSFEEARIWYLRAVSGLDIAVALAMYLR